MKKITKIEIKRIEDESPDTSWLGLYSDKAETEYAIRLPNTDFRQYKYFNGPVENYDGETKENIRKYIQQDYERMETFNKGGWWFIGIKAKAAIQTSDDGSHWLINTVSSGGLWGIESDSDRKYLDDVGQEQLDELKDVLLELGFSKEEIETACTLLEKE